MMSTATSRHSALAFPDPDSLGYRPGPLGRLGVWVTHHRKLTAGVWLLLIVGLGAFAPKVEADLSGASWQADGSESVAVRERDRSRWGVPRAPRRHLDRRSSCRLRRSRLAVLPQLGPGGRSRRRCVTHRGTPVPPGTPRGG